MPGVWNGPNGAARIALKWPRPNIQYEIADRIRAVNAGGIGAAHLLVKRLGLDQAINEWLGLLKVHLLYHVSDPVLSIVSRGMDAPVPNRA